MKATVTVDMNRDARGRSWQAVLADALHRAAFEVPRLADKAGPRGLILLHDLKGNVIGELSVAE